MYIRLAHEALKSTDSEAPLLKTLVSSGGLECVLELEFLKSITAASEEVVLGPLMRYILRGGPE